MFWTLWVVSNSKLDLVGTYFRSKVIDYYAELVDNISYIFGLT